jgi:hypothetical protein
MAEPTDAVLVPLPQEPPEDCQVQLVYTRTRRVSQRWKRYPGNVGWHDLETGERYFWEDIVALAFSLNRYQAEVHLQYVEVDDG